MKVPKTKLLRWTLERQGLLKRFHARSPITCFGPFHSTDQTTPFLSLLARIENFPNQWRELYAESMISTERQFLRIRCMRGTLHLIPLEDVTCVQQVYSHSAKKFISEGKAKLSDKQLKAITEDILDTLALHGPMPTPRFQKLIPKQTSIPKEVYESNQFGLKKVLDYLCNCGTVHYGILAPPPLEYKKSNSKKDNSLWNMRIFNWSLPSIEAEPIKPPNDDEELEEAEMNLCLWYFSLYGPASFKDFVWWTGRPVGRMRAAFESIKPQLEPVSVSDVSEFPELYIMKSQVEQLKIMPDHAILGMCRFLPYEDALIKAYKETRCRFSAFDEDTILPKVIIAGVANPSIWIDGEMVGIWERNTQDGIVYSLFKTLSSQQQSLLDEELAILETFCSISK